jgi:hypothetical protein
MRGRCMGFRRIHAYAEGDSEWDTRIAMPLLYLCSRIASDREKTKF